MYIFCNVRVCVCMGFVMFGCVYVWALKCVGVCTYDFVTSGCVYYGFCNVLLCVCVGFILSGCAYVWVL